jgi:hypothetical protein
VEGLGGKYTLSRLLLKSMLAKEDPNPLLVPFFNCFRHIPCFCSSILPLNCFLHFTGRKENIV